MKKGIHPEYQGKTTITCSCGSVLEVGAIKKDMTVEICSQCHPFYTGKKKMIDSTGRVDRFKKITEKASVKKQETKVKKKESKTKKEAKKPVAKKTTSKASKK